MREKAIVLAAILTLGVPAKAQAQEADRVYIDAIVPHDEVTLSMATDASEKANQKQLRTFAKKLRERTLYDISSLKTFRRKWFGSPNTPAFPFLNRQVIPKGGAYDRLWMEAMIVQDQSAIDLSRLGLYTISHDELKKYARGSIDTLTKEQNQLRSWIRTWYR